MFSRARYACQLVRAKYDHEMALYRAVTSPVPDPPWERAYRPVTRHELMLGLKASFFNYKQDMIMGVRVVFPSKQVRLQHQEWLREQAIRQEQARNQSSSSSSSSSHPDLFTLHHPVFSFSKQLRDTLSSTSPFPPAGEHDSTSEDFLKRRIIFIRRCIQSFVLGYREGYQKRDSSSSA